MKASNVDKNQRSILVVDDDDSFRLVIKQVLSSVGNYRVDDCDSGEAALNALQLERYDVVILDYKMTGISGLNVLQWMHEQKIDTPVVMLTAAGSESIAVEAMKLGAYDYARKEHVEIDHISILISGVIERYLFRKEKERREMIEREREKSLVAIETFHSTLASIVQIVNNSLSMVSLNIQEHETELKPFVTPEGQQRLAKAFAEMKQEYAVISSAVKSMLNMANVLHGNFTDTNYTAQLQETLNGNLKTLQQQTGSQQIQRKP
ncbi:MAG: response regulator [Ignavibacteriales bacterium]|nr:response regulator [Ignavibacteriales bacterium]